MLCGGNGKYSLKSENAQSKFNGFNMRVLFLENYYALKLFRIKFRQTNWSFYLESICTLL